MRPSARFYAPRHLQADSLRPVRLRDQYHTGVSKSHKRKVEEKHVESVEVLTKEIVVQPDVDDSGASTF